MVQVKVPPHSDEAEKIILLALLFYKDSIVQVAEFLRPEHFYSDIHGLVFEAILELYEERKPIDLVTLTNTLKKAKALQKIGGSAYLSELVTAVPTAAHIESYARIIREHAVRRQLISNSSRFIDMAYYEGL